MQAAADDSEEGDEVQTILDQRVTENGSKQYLIRWAGFSQEYDSWEPEGNLINCDDELAKFKEKLGEKE